MEIKNKWSVLECPKCKKRGYYYLGSDPAPENTDKYKHAGFEKEDLTCCEQTRIEISYENWSAEDISEIFGNELEDRNHHWLTDMPQLLLDALNKTELPTRQHHAQIMRLFMENMSKKWN